MGDLMSIKIKDIIVHVIKSELDIPFAFSQGWVKKRSATLVEIKTDEGLIGWGEAFCQGLEPPEISAAVIETALKPLLLDESPMSMLSRIDEDANDNSVSVRKKLGFEELFDTTDPKVDDMDDVVGLSLIHI